MARGFEAITKVTIHASKRDVWNALTNPEKVKQYMHGTDGLEGVQPDLLEV